MHDLADKNAHLSPVSFLLWVQAGHPPCGSSPVLVASLPELRCAALCCAFADREGQGPAVCTSQVGRLESMRVNVE